VRIRKYVLQEEGAGRGRGNEREKKQTQRHQDEKCKGPRRPYREGERPDTKEAGPRETFSDLVTGRERNRLPIWNTGGKRKEK